MIDKLKHPDISGQNREKSTDIDLVLARLSGPGSGGKAGSGNRPRGGSRPNPSKNRNQRPRPDRIRRPSPPSLRPKLEDARSTGDRGTKGAEGVKDARSAGGDRSQRDNRSPSGDRKDTSFSPRRAKKPRFKDRQQGLRPIKRLPKLDRGPEREKITSDQTDTLKIIPLGGLGEIGRNMTVFEYHEDIIIVDIGLGFPEDDQPGIDYTIPNISYLDGKQDKIRGIFITHGHLDHVGALPYLIRRLGNPTIYTADLTRGLMIRRHEEFPHLPKLDVEIIKAGENIKIGTHFEVEPFAMNHTIPDDFALIINTPAGRIFFTSDFKFDPEPVNQKPIDFNELKKIGDRGISILMADSTGAEKEGETISETTTKKNLDKIIAESKGKVIASTFSSLINRIQQLIEISEKYGRKVILDGFSLKNAVAIAKELKQITMKKNTQIPISEIDNYPPEKITVIGTGAQGEGRAMLMRIASGEHKYIKLMKKDSVIFSSSIVPGNERSVQRLKDLLYRMGTKVYHYGMMDLHASGHGNRGDLRKMIQLMRPEVLFPVHGYYSMMVNHAGLGQGEGISIIIN